MKQNCKAKWGIVGCGNIAQKRFFPAIISHEYAELKAIADLNAQNLELSAHKFGIKQTFLNPEDLIDCKDIQAVYIATPVYTHFDLAMLCARKNKHVLLEKPMALNLEQSNIMLNTFQEKGLSLSVGYMMKNHNLHILAKDLVKSGKIGQLINISMRYNCFYPKIKNAWRQTKAYAGGGAVMDLAVHCFDLISFITGRQIVETVSYLDTLTFDYEVEDSAVIIAKLDNGILANVNVNFNIPDNVSAPKIEIYGASGSIVISDTIGQEEIGSLTVVTSNQKEFDQRGIKQNVELYEGAQRCLYTKEIEDLSKQIINNNPDYVNAKQAYNVQKICQSIYDNYDLKIHKRQNLAIL